MTRSYLLSKKGPNAKQIQFHKTGQRDRRLDNWRSVSVVAIKAKTKPVATPKHMNCEILYENGYHVITILCYNNIIIYDNIW